MHTINTDEKELEFITAYFEAINFTETGDTDQPDSGADLDDTFRRESIIDCLAFYNRIRCYLSDDNIEQAGHDFWLTRNHHGTGFWDRPEIYGDTYSQPFTKRSKSMGEVNSFFENEIV